jgi:hypothetical protein
MNRTIALAGVLPPGTLTVVPGTVQEMRIESLPTLNWAYSSWLQFPLHWKDPLGVGWNKDLNPQASVLTTAARAAEAKNILPFVPPAMNSSYSMPVRGPYIQCESANSTQLPFFNFYTNILGQKDLYTVVTTPPVPYEVPAVHTPAMLFFSAFDPTMFNYWPIGGLSVNDGPDEYNNWNVTLPAGFLDYYSYPQNLTYTLPNGSITHEIGRFVPRQLFVQTSQESFVCTLGNGTREVTFNFTDGRQHVTYGPLQNFDPLFVL